MIRHNDYPCKAWPGDKLICYAMDSKVYGLPLFAFVTETSGNKTSALLTKASAAELYEQLGEFING